MICTLLNVRPFNFTDEQSGNVIKGAKVMLLTGDKVTGDGAIGNRVDDVTVSWDVYSQISSLFNGVELPVKVEVGYEMRGFKNAPRLNSLKPILK